MHVNTVSRGHLSMTHVALSLPCQLQGPKHVIDHTVFTASHLRQVQLGVNCLELNQLSDLLRSPNPRCAIMFKGCQQDFLQLATSKHPGMSECVHMTCCMQSHASCCLLDVIALYVFLIPFITGIPSSSFPSSLHISTVLLLF